MKLSKAILKILGIYAQIRMLDSQIHELADYVKNNDPLDRAEVEARVDTLNVLWEEIT